MTQLQRIRELERIIVDAISGMDPDDRLCTVKVHYADGSARWLVDVIAELNALRFEQEEKARRKLQRIRERAE